MLLCGRYRLAESVEHVSATSVVIRAWEYLSDFNLDTSKTSSTSIRGTVTKTLTDSDTDTSNKGSTSTTVTPISKCGVETESERYFRSTFQYFSKKKEGWLSWRELKAASAKLGLCTLSFVPENLLVGKTVLEEVDTVETIENSV